MSERNRNAIKTSFDRLMLSDAAKRRIVAACRADGAPERTKSLRAVWTVALAVFLTAALTVGALAAVGVFSKGPGELKSHIDTEREIEFDPIVVDLPSGENEALSDDGQYVLRFNAITGSEEKIYIDCTLTRKDGGVITDVRKEDGSLPHLNGHGMIKLSDGGAADVVFYALSDSVETEYHMEGMVVLIREHDADQDHNDEYHNRYYSAEEINAKLDGATVMPGGFRLRADIFDPIRFAAEDLGTILEGIAPGETYPFEERGLNIPLSADGSVEIDNYTYAPYEVSGYTDAPQALYLRLKGYVGDYNSFRVQRKDGVSIYRGLAVERAGEYTTVVIFKEDGDVTPYDLENITGLDGVRSVDDTVCGFSSEISVKGGFKNSVVETEFDPVEVVYEDGKMTLFRARITNTSLTLYGHGEGEGEAADLDTLCREAYVVTLDGAAVPLGTKFGCGTINGENLLEWQCATALDPERIASIHIGDSVITIK